MYVCTCKLKKNQPFEFGHINFLFFSARHGDSRFFSFFSFFPLMRSQRGICWGFINKRNDVVAPQLIFRWHPCPCKMTTWSLPPVEYFLLLIYFSPGAISSQKQPSQNLHSRHQSTEGLARSLFVEIIQNLSSVIITRFQFSGYVKRCLDYLFWRNRVIYHDWVILHDDGEWHSMNILASRRRRSIYWLPLDG